MLSEISQTENDIYHIISYVESSEQNNLTHKIQKHRYVEQTGRCQRGGRLGDWVKNEVKGLSKNRYILYMSYICVYSHNLVLVNFRTCQTLCSLHFDKKRMFQHLALAWDLSHLLDLV